MMPAEKQTLLELLHHESCWCQHVEARDLASNPVHCDDPAATAWDLSGAILHLFGDRRAVELYRQLDRHISRARRAPDRFSDLALDAMVALQAFNDRADTTFEVLRARLSAIPVWTNKTSIEPAAGPAIPGNGSDSLTAE